MTLPPEAAAQLVAPDPGAAPIGIPDSVIGSLVIESDIAVKVYLNGRLLGSATRRRFGVPAGDHNVTLVNESRNFRSSQPVRVVAGRSLLVVAKPSDVP
jgi:antitoxin component of MazEF toxin-antitoxin module